MKNSAKNNIKLLAWFAAIAIVITMAVVFICTFSAKSKAPQSEMSSQGEAVIRKMEQIPFAPIEEKIFEMEKQEINRQLLEDPSRIFQTLSDINTVILGDSRVVGFMAYGYMDPSRIMAGTSWSIMEMPALFPQVEQMNPRFVIVAFGINEMGHQLDEPVYFSTDEMYIEALSYYMNQLRSVVPNAKIYFNSILPANEVGLSISPGFGIIPRRNQAIKEFCEREGYGYIDVEEIANEHPELYIEDGVHFFSEFYPLWGSQILNQIIIDGGLD